MRLDVMTLDSFLCRGHITPASAAQDSFTPLASTVGGLIGKNLRLLGHGYSIVRLQSDDGDVALLHYGVPVGCYLTDVLAIKPIHQKKGLATPLIHVAVEYRRAPSKRTLSSDGERALTRAWLSANSMLKNPWI